MYSSSTVVTVQRALALWAVTCSLVGLVVYRQVTLLIPAALACVAPRLHERRLAWWSLLGFVPLLLAFDRPVLNVLCACASFCAAFSALVRPDGELCRQLAQHIRWCALGVHGLACVLLWFRVHAMAAVFYADDEYPVQWWWLSLGFLLGCIPHTSTAAFLAMALSHMPLSSLLWTWQAVLYLTQGVKKF